ncbi:UNVERIFIED_CONTAM: hypothetical protein GTU68_020136 [Idotea baltica]|nr:hypothetical protein [Idotea baltica]
MKTLNVNNDNKNYDMLPLEPDFTFEDVANEICIGESDNHKSYDQIYLDGPNESKLMITFQYSDLEKNFIDEDIFYSEEIEVKEERESENEVIDHDDSAKNVPSLPSTLPSNIPYSQSSNLPSSFLDVQNEVVIEKEGSGSYEADSYGQAILNLVPNKNEANVSEDFNMYRKHKFKEETVAPAATSNSTSDIPVFSDEEKPKSIFGASMGVSKCNICHKYTKRSCYEAHMREHFETDMAKSNPEKKSFPNEVAEVLARAIKADSTEITPQQFETSFIDNLTYSHEEEVVDQKFHCEQCEFFTFSKEELGHHMKLHDCQKLNKCPFCDYESAQMITMKAHIKSHESNSSYECNKCTYRTTERAHFTRHMRRHTGDKPFKCNLCGYSAVQGSALKSHIRRHYGEKPHKCPFCEYRSVERTSLVRHVRVHTGEKPHACPFCDYKSIQKSSLKAHLKKHNGEHHECDKCEFKTIQKTCLSRHLKRHNPEKPHKCKLCNYQSIQKASLRTHMRRHLGEKPYQCSHCDYSCVEKTHLNRHLRQHTGEKPIFCFVCDYRCIQFSSLVSHVKRHEGMLIHCAFCAFKTVRTELLLNHLKAEHKGSWNAQNVNCPLCDFQCHTKEQLDSHMRNHIESFAQDAANAVSEKVYRCSQCDFKSINKKLLKVHKKIHKQRKADSVAL